MSFIFNIQKLEIMMENQYSKKLTLVQKRINTLVDKNKSLRKEIAELKEDKELLRNSLLTVAMHKGDLMYRKQKQLREVFGIDIITKPFYNKDKGIMLYSSELRSLTYPNCVVHSPILPTYEESLNWILEYTRRNLINLA